MTVSCGMENQFLASKLAQFQYEKTKKKSGELEYSFVILYVH